MATSTGRSSGQNCTFDVTDIKVVTEFAYLGLQLTDKNESLSIVNHHLAVGNRAYFKYNNIIKSKIV